MLVLSRKLNEKIRIGPDVVINVIAISENQVKIGIEAPVDIKILRDELYEHIKRQNEQVAELSKEILKSTDLSQLKIKPLNKDAGFGGE